MTSVYDTALRRRLAFNWLYLAVAAVVSAALLAIDGHERYQSTERNERARLLAQARTVAINLEHQLGLTKASLDATVEDLPKWKREEGYSDGILLRIRALESSLPGVRTILVTDSRGVVRAANRESLLGMDFSRRDWFKVPLAAANPDTIHLSPPFNTVSGAWGMNLSRIISSPREGFAGVIAITLDEKYFETLLHSVNYAEDGWAAALHGDGEFFTGVPSRVQFVGRSAAIPGTVFSRHIESGQRENVMTGKSSIAEGERITAIVTVGGELLGVDKPIIVCMSRSRGGVFAAWRKDAAKKAAVFVFLLLVAAVTLKAHHRRELRIADDAERSERTIRLWADAFERCAYGIGLCIPTTGRILTCNSAFAAILGRTAEEISGVAVLDLYDPSDRVFVSQKIAEVDRTGQVHYRSRMVRKDGTMLPVEVSSVAVKNAAGVAEYRVCSICDVGEREMTETALKFLSTEIAHLTGAAFFEAIAKQVAFVHGADVGFVGRRRVNPAGHIETVGLSVDGNIVAPITFDLAGTPCKRVLDGEFVMFSEGVRKTFPRGTILENFSVTSYAAFPLLDSKNRAMGVVGVMGRRPFRSPEKIETILRLFALRTASEMERELAESRFHGLFEFSPDAVLLVTQEGKIVLANRRASELLGYSGEELVGMSVEQFMPESIRSNHAELRRRYLAAPNLRLMGARPDGFHARRKDGSIINVDIALGPIMADDGEQLTIVEMRDITARIEAKMKSKALEAQLRQSQKMDAVGRLSGGIAHDFNNLLQVVSINAEMAKDNLPQGSPAGRHIERIAKAADRASELTQRLLAFSRRQPLAPKAVDLRKLAAGMVPMLERILPETIAIEVVTKELSPVVFVDPGELESALLNLAVNARDAMPDGGRLTIETGTRVFIGGARADDVPAGTYGMVAVSDTGCGMTAEVRDRVFEPFFTTKEVGKGTGLGLSIVYGFVQQSGGQVEIDSEAGNGTRVTILLPSTTDTATELSASLPHIELPRGNETVLVVEDDEMVRVHAVESIQSLGYRVVEAKDGYEALYFLVNDPEIDLLFTDVVMPGGMNGKQLAERAREIRRSLRIVFTSGYADSVLDLENLDVALLSKPYKRDQLAWMLRRALDGKNG